MQQIRGTNTDRLHRCRNYDAQYPAAYRESEDDDVKVVRPLSRAYIPGSEKTLSSTGTLSSKLTSIHCLPNPADHVVKPRSP